MRDYCHLVVMLNNLQQKLISNTDSQKFLVAYSGGMDSHVLLHAMAALAKTAGFSVRAAHIHHGLSDNADYWEQHCQDICRELGVELVVTRVEVNAGKNSVEAIARDLRYQQLANILQPNECLVVAHHADDQAETLLLQMLRGLELLD